MKVTTNIPAGTEVLVKGTAVAADSFDFIGRIPIKIGTYVYWLEAGLIAGIVPTQAEPPQKPSNQEIIRQAINDGDDILFNYQKEDGTIQHRAVDPESLFTSRRGQELVGGYDLDEVYGDSYRAFRLDRIQGEVEIN